MKTSGYLITEGDFTEEVEDALLSAGFIWEDYYEDYELPDDWLTYLYVDLMRDWTVIQFYGSYKPIPVEPHTAAEASAAIVDFYANQGMQVEVPDYATADPEAYFGFRDASAVNGFEVDVYESSAEEMFDFVVELEAAGWVISDGEYEGDYVANVEFDDGSYAQIDVQDWIDYSYACVRLICTYGVPAEFPAEDVAADMAALGVTDEVPPFPGVALDYNYSAKYHQLTVVVKSGTEQDNVDLYAAAFVAAGYTEAGADEYGDMHYTSPNQQLDICVWCYPSEYPGYVIVDFDPLNRTWTASDVATELGAKFNKTPTDYSEQAGYPYFAFSGAFYASSVSADYLKDYIDSNCILSGFSKLLDWTAGSSADGGFEDDGPYDFEYMFINCDNIYARFEVSSQDYSGTAITVLMVTVFEYTA